MLRRTFLLGSIAFAAAPFTASAATTAKLYKDPNCGCCGSYANYLRGNGFSVEVIEAAEFAEIGRKAGVPANLEGCHTTFVGDYAVSGHVPVEVVQKLLREQPRIAGVTLAGMPAGSPGMGGEKTEPFTIHAFTKDGAAPYVYIAF